MALLPAGDLPHVMVVGHYVQFLSLSKDYALPKCLQGTKTSISTKQVGIPALFVSDKGKITQMSVQSMFMSVFHS